MLQSTLKNMPKYIRNSARYTVTLACLLVLIIVLFADTSINIHSINSSGEDALSKSWPEDSVGEDTNRYRVQQVQILSQQPSQDIYEIPPYKKQRDRIERVRLQSNYSTKCGQKQRKDLLNKNCKIYEPKGKLDSRSVSMILVDEIHKILYCEIPKVACTSWKSFLAGLSGNLDPVEYSKLSSLVHKTDFYPKVGFRYLSSLSEKEQQYRLENYYKFMVVRNPFARMISAYENKIHNRNEPSRYFKSIGTYITKNYQKNPSEEALQSGSNATFSEFVRFLVNETEPEFYRVDTHWWLMHDNCLPCEYTYDYIAKLETLQDDLDVMIESILPDNPSAELLKDQFPHMNANAQQAERLKVKRYFEQLSPDLLEKVKIRYNLDSKLFGYSIYQNDVECHS